MPPLIIALYEHFCDYGTGLGLRFMGSDPQPGNVHTAAGMVFHVGVGPLDRATLLIGPTQMAWQTSSGGRVAVEHIDPGSVELVEGAMRSWAADHIEGLMARRQMIGLDFDGVLHSYGSGWLGADRIPDPPVAGAVEFLLSRRQEFALVIHSSRCGQPGGMAAIRDWLVLWGVPPDLVLLVHDHRELEAVVWDGGPIVVSAVKPPAHLSLDDRAVTFRGTFPTAGELRDFRPWHKP